MPAAGVSLLEETRERLVSRFGDLPDEIAHSDSVAVWSFASSTNKVLVVEDMLQDDLLKHHSRARNPPYMRFFACSPIVINGIKVGMLFVLDYEPRSLDDAEIDLLGILSETIASDINSARQTSILSTAVDILNEACLVVDASDSTLPIIFCNSGWVSISGRYRNDTVGKSLHEAFGEPEGIHDRCAELHQIAHEGSSQSNMQKIITSDGSQLITKMSFTPADQVNSEEAEQDTAPLRHYYFAMLSDITELENDRVQMDEAAVAANNAAGAKSLFLANTSHEIKTPLNAVVASSGLLEEQEGHTDETREMFSMIRKGGEQLMDLVNDVLDLSRIEQYQLSLIFGRFSLWSLIEQCVESAATRANAKVLPLTFTIEKDVPDCVWGDEYWLRQALLNVLVNGVKFTDKGYVEVRVKRAVLEHGEEPPQSALPSSEQTSPDRTTPQKVLFEVTDTGRGISDEEMSSLFVAFSQIDKSRTREHSGMGTGLSKSRLLSRKMGGDLTCTSTPSEGVFSSLRACSAQYLKSSFSALYSDAGSTFSLSAWITTSENNSRAAGPTTHEFVKVLSQDKYFQHNAQSSCRLLNWQIEFIEDERTAEECARPAWFLPQRIRSWSDPLVLWWYFREMKLLVNGESNARAIIFDLDNLPASVDEMVSQLLDDLPSEQNMRGDFEQHGRISGGMASADTNLVNEGVGQAPARPDNASQSPWIERLAATLERLMAERRRTVPIIPLSVQGANEAVLDGLGHSVAALPITSRKLSNAIQKWELRQSMQTQAEEKRGIATSDLNILVAEDNQVNQYVIRKLLHSLNCVCTLVSDGTDAVEEVATAISDDSREECDLIFMVSAKTQPARKPSSASSMLSCPAIGLQDIQMLRMDGTTATRRIRNDERVGGKQPMIIALTADAIAHAGQQREHLNGCAHHMPGFRIQRCLQSAMR